ncbi:MAG: amidohydrolase family protein [Bacteroidota bacterium]
MSRAYFFILIFTNCFFYSDLRAQLADLAITNITLINGTGKVVQESKTILIKEGRFLDIIDAKEKCKARSFVDGTGKYVIPGLFDNHVHIGPEFRWPLVMSQFIHFGITSVLIPGTNNQKFLQFKERIKEENLIAPHLYHTSLMISMEGKHPAKTYGDHYVDGVNVHYVKDETSIEPIVSQAVKDAAIAIKVMIEDGPQPPFVTRIPEKYVSLLSAQAHIVGLDFFAHVSDMYEVRAAVNNQADALMHFMGVQIDWENDLEVMQQIVDQNISWVSTAMIGKSFFHPLHQEWLENEHYEVFSQEQKRYFNDEDGSMKATSTAVLENMFGGAEIPPEAMLKPMMEDIKKLYDMGVNIVVGTDLGGRPYIMPGYSFHEEMQLFELGGFSGEQIIQCATLNAAKMLKVDDDYGSIEKGKVADMVLLKKNPLIDIKNTLSIETVFKRGKVQKRLEDE